MKEPREPEENEGFNDAYDVIKAALEVKTQHDTLNSDFIIADIKPEIMQNNMIIYVANHLNIMVAINNYLNKEEDKEYLEMTRKLLLDEIYSIVNLSRADNGKVLLAILDYIRGQGNQQQLPNTEETEGKKGVFTKIGEKVGIK